MPKAAKVNVELATGAPAPEKAKKVRTAPTKDEIINIQEMELNELKGLNEQLFQRLRNLENQYGKMEAFYMKRLDLISDTLTFLKSTLVADTKGEK